MGWLYFAAGIAFCLVTMAIGLAIAIVHWMMKELDDHFR